VKRILQESIKNHFLQGKGDIYLERFFSKISFLPKSVQKIITIVSFDINGKYFGSSLFAAKNDHNNVLKMISPYLKINKESMIDYIIYSQFLHKEKDLNLFFSILNENNCDAFKNAYYFLPKKIYTDFHCYYGKILLNEKINYF
jgi:hypothetical protein